VDSANVFLKDTHDALGKASTHAANAYGVYHSGYTSDGKLIPEDQREAYIRSEIHEANNQIAIFNQELGNVLNRLSAAQSWAETQYNGIMGDLNKL
jgi:hypothetical protein